MAEFELVLFGDDEIRWAGSISCDTLAEAIGAVDAEEMALHGDRLLIGVAGFPPAAFERIAEGHSDIEPLWCPRGAGFQPGIAA